MTVSKTRETDPEKRWRAVVAHDAQADGAFVYAVRSTGIYCRPSCPSRRPRRAQVVFFDAPAEAERAGFRACRRCRPGEQAPRVDLRVSWVRRACRFLEERPEETITLKALAEQVGRSPHHVQRVFKQLTGVSPRQYADACRVTRVRSEIRSRDNVTAALYEAGYGSASRLYERASSQLGMTPGTYRRGGEGMSIEFAVVPCALGRVLVAATERGVCMVSLGGSRATLEAELRREYPAARIEHRTAAGLERWIAPLLEHLAGRLPHLELPLDVQATAFKRRVWEELQAIPYGATRTYTEVARAIGRPRAVRAVARACATNPVSVVVPCHRVIGSDGRLHGYRWGLERKQALLDAEKNGAAPAAGPAAAAISTAAAHGRRRSSARGRPRA